MDLRILPAIAQVSTHTVKADQATIINQSEALRRLIVVFVNLWQSVRKRELLTVHRMRKRQLLQIEFREYPLHLRSNELIHSIIIINLQKTASNQVIPEIFGLLRRENDVSVAGHMNERVIEYFRTAHLHNSLFQDRYWWKGSDCKNDTGLAETIQIGIPVATSAIFQKGDLKDGDGSEKAEKTTRIIKAPITILILIMVQKYTKRNCKSAIGSQGVSF